jgi:AP-2 complex subunit alpha
MSGLQLAVSSFNAAMIAAGYDKRKYVWKLLYIYMLGYPVEFGHKQAADLIPQPK